MSTIKKIFKSQAFNRLLLAYVSAYILMFFSEYFFVNEETAFELIDTIINRPYDLFYLFEFIFWYFIPTYIFLMAIEYFNIRSVWALLLAWWLYWWSVEWFVAIQLYESFPFSILWTWFAWHSLVDVLIGWYFIRYILNKNNYLYTFILSLILGLFWWSWATWFWVEGVSAIKVFDFTIYTFFTTFLLILSYIILEICIKNTIKFWFKYSKTEFYIIFILSILMIGVLSVSLIWLPLITLVPLFWFTFFILWKNKKIENWKNIIYDNFNKIKISNYLIILLMPFVASISYYFYYKGETTSFIWENLPFMLTWISFFVLLFSIYKILFRNFWKKI